MLPPCLLLLVLLLLLLPLLPTLTMCFMCFHQHQHFLSRLYYSTLAGCFALCLPGAGCFASVAMAKRAHRKTSLKPGPGASSSDRPACVDPYRRGEPPGCAQTVQGSSDTFAGSCTLVHSPVGSPVPTLVFHPSCDSAAPIDWRSARRTEMRSSWWLAPLDAVLHEEWLQLVQANSFYS